MHSNVEFKESREVLWRKEAEETNKIIFGGHIPNLQAYFTFTKLLFSESLAINFDETPEGEVS